jgi:hypothetical protein
VRQLQVGSYSKLTGSLKRLWNDKSATLTTLIGRVILALIIGSIYFG